MTNGFKKGDALRVVVVSDNNGPYRWVVVAADHTLFSSDDVEEANKVCAAINEYRKYLKRVLGE